MSTLELAVTIVSAGVGVATAAATFIQNGPMGAVLK
jgi:hypothetical protein